MQRWAFARISLRLTDEEFFRYTPAQIQALTQTWEAEQQWQYAVAMSAAMSARWGGQENPVPFTPKDFLPKTSEEQKKHDADMARLQAAQQKFLAAGLTALSKRLPKTP